MRDWFYKGNHILEVVMVICHDDNKCSEGIMKM